MNIFFKKNFDIFLVILTVYFYIYIQLPFTHVSVFQARDLDRAYELINGKFIFFGPELTGGGNLPGALYYYLLAAALKVDASWNGVWMLFSLFAAFTFGIIWKTLTRLYCLETSFIVLFGLITIPQTTLIYVAFINSSFLPFFVALFCGLTAQLIFINNKNAKKYYWYGLCFLFALAIQIHFSITFIFLGLCFYLWIQNISDNKIISKKSFFIGLFFFLLPLIPFLAWKWGLLKNLDTQGALIYSQNYDKVLDSFVENIDKIRSGASAEGNIFVFLRSLISIVIPLVLLFIFYNFRKKNYIQNNFISIKNNIWFYYFCFSIPLFLGIYPYLTRTRYLIPFYYCSVFLIASLLDPILKKINEKNKIFFTISIFLSYYLSNFLINPILKINEVIIYLLLSILISALYYFSYKIYLKKILLCIMLAFTFIFLLHIKNENRNNYPSGKDYASFKELFEKIISKTGWSYEDARKRIILIDYHYQINYKYVYKEVFKNWAHFENLNLNKHNPPDGYIVFRFKNKINNNFFVFKVIRKLMRFHLEKSLYKKMLDSDLDPKNIEIFDWGAAVPIKFFDRRLVILTPHNVGCGYEPECFAGRNYESFTESVEKNENTLFIKFNNHPNKNEYLDLTFSLTKKNDQFLFSLDGNSIAQSSPWVAPGWVEGLENIWVTIKCDKNSKEETFQLAKHIGYAPETEIKTVLDYSLLAPVEGSFLNPCHENKEIFQIKFGYDSLDIYSNSKYSTAPGREFKLNYF